uniref:TNFR-Cys domain-containing protein n=1 Tax=Falco tinnunculus TaxID=100819 RepID=A0A8C4XLP1_FALTI
MLLVMPGASAEDCREGEYLHEGCCCVSCPAGTFVAQHCSAPHLRGRCDPCVEGESYTAHENGLEGCLSCRQCKDDQITLRPCTRTHDTECQCKQGYFCPAEGCEICQRCSTMCPEGKEIVQNCNATMDLGCGLPDQGSRAFVYIMVITVIIVVVAAAVSVLLVRCRNLKSDKAASVEGAEKGLEFEGSTRSLILPEVETPATNTASPEGGNSGESPEGQVQTSVSLEVENTLPEENSIVLSERGSVPQRGWRRRHMERCWRRIVNSSLPAKIGQTLAFHQNDPPRVPSGSMPVNCMVQEPTCQIIVNDLSQKGKYSINFHNSINFKNFINSKKIKYWKFFSC